MRFRAPRVTSLSIYSIIGRPESIDTDHPIVPSVMKFPRNTRLGISTDEPDHARAISARA